MRHEGEARENAIDKAFRWSNYGIGVLLLVTVAGVVAWQFFSVAKDANRSIDDLLAYFQEGGLQVGSHESLADKAGATWAERADINGQEVNIYRFAPEISDEQKARLKTVQRAGAIEVDGEAVPAKTNGPFVLTGYEGNPREEDLLTAFNGFGTF
jgi:hypothetical protein